MDALISQLIQGVLFFNVAQIGHCYDASGETFGRVRMDRDWDRPGAVLCLQ